MQTINTDNIRTEFSTSADENIRSMKKQIRIEENFDILTREIIIGGKKALAAALDKIKEAVSHTALEIIGVDHQQRHRCLLARGAAPFHFKVFVEVATIGQPGQAIGVHQALQHQVGVEQLLLADPQRTVGRIPLQQGHVGARVISDARHQFDGVRQFHQIIVGPRRERRALDQRVFLGGKHDDRDVLRGRVVAVFAHQGQPV